MKLEQRRKAQIHILSYLQRQYAIQRLIVQEVTIKGFLRVDKAKDVVSQELANITQGEIDAALVHLHSRAFIRFDVNARNTVHIKLNLNTQP